jgi:hypothetical protein
MKNPGNSKVNTRGFAFWFFSTLVILTGFFLSGCYIYEYYTVKYGGEESAYFFGDTNENGWLYKSATIYSTSVFLTAFLFLTATTIALAGAIKRNTRAVSVGGFLIGLFFLIMLIMACC